MTQEQMLLRRLREIRSRIRALFALHGVGRLLMVLPPAILAAILLDYFLPGHFPRLLRGMLLLGLAALAVLLTVRHLWRPLRTPITVGDVALELEGQFPQLDDRLASTVDFLRDEPRHGESQDLRGAVIKDTLQVTHGMNLRRALRPRPLVIVFLVGLLVAAAVGGLGAAYSDAASIGLQRLFNPLSPAEWPKRHHLLLDTQRIVIPIGTDHLVRVQLAPGSQVPGRVEIFYREVGEDTFEPGGVMKQQTVAGEVVFTYPFTRVRKSFEYYVRGGDDVAPDTGTVTVEVRPRPRVETITLTITPPSYVTGTEPEVVPGQGMTRALQGSVIRMDVLTNKPIGVDGEGNPRAAMVFSTSDRPAVPLAFAKPDEPVPGLPLGSGGATAPPAANTHLVLQIELEETVEFDFRFVCVDRFQSQPSESTYRFEAEIDQPPTVVFEQPTQAVMEVTTRSVVPIEVRVKDDYGVARTALGWQRLRTEQKDVMDLAEYFIEKGTEQRPLSLWANRRWDLRDIYPALNEGDEVVYRAVAMDNFNWRGKDPHTGESQVYRLRVVSQKSVADRLRQELAALGMRVDDLVERQENLQGQTKDTRAGKPTDQPLSAKGREQTTAQEGNQRELKGRAEKLADDFEQLLEDFRLHRVPQDEAFDHAKALREALDEVAEDPMPKAGDALRGTRDAEATPQKQSEQLDQAVDEMQRVIDRLNDSLGDLAKFNEAEQLSRELKRILRDQKAMTQRTKAHAAQTLGKSQDELSPAEREAQQGIEQRQRELSRETKDTIKKIKDAAERLKQADEQALSDALKEAVEEAETRGPAQKMEKAAAQVGQNQASNAQANQEGAEEDLQRIIDKLEDRRVTELKDRIRTLEQFKGEVDELKKREEGHLKENQDAQAGDKKAAEPKEQAGKQQKTAKDTKNLAGKMQEAEAGDATESTEQAGESMEQASESLSQSQSPKAEEEQKEAIEKLEQAKKELEEEIQRAKDELTAEQLEQMKQKLSRIKDGETQVRQATGEIEDKKQTAKLERSDLGKLAFNQDKQKELLNETGDILGELEEAGVKVFRFALTIVADRMVESHDRLMKRDTDTVTQAAQDKAIFILAQLIEALEEEISDRKQQQQQGGGQGGQQGPAQLVPTLAELKMLRMMQLGINEATLKADEVAAKAEKVPPEVEAEAQRLGRDQDKLKKLMETLTDPTAMGPEGERI